MKRINIAFICDILEVGGQERISLNMLENIDRTVFHPFMYAFRGGTFVRAIKDLGIALRIGSNKGPLSFKKAWTEEDAEEKKNFMRCLVDELRQNKIDVSLIFAWPDGVAASQIAAVPVVIEKMDGPRLMQKIGDKSGLDKIICESKTMKNMLLSQKERLRCQDDQIEVIHNGIDLKRFARKSNASKRVREAYGLDSGELVIGYIGRITAEKNLRLLIESASQLRNFYKIDNFKVIIVGPDHGDLTNLKDYAFQLGLDSRVIFVGTQLDVSEMLCAFDIFAYTSLQGEGTPTAILEAMAMGLPIVSLAAGSIPELIHGNGFLIGQNNPKIFAEHLRILITNRKLRNKMGRESISRSKKYDIHLSIKQYERLFISCLKKKNVIV